MIIDLSDRYYELDYDVLKDSYNAIIRALRIPMITMYMSKIIVLQYKNYLYILKNIESEEINEKDYVDKVDVIYDSDYIESYWRAMRESKSTLHKNAIYGLPRNRSLIVINSINMGDMLSEQRVIFDINGEPSMFDYHSYSVDDALAYFTESIYPYCSLPDEMKADVIGSIKDFYEAHEND